MPAKTAKQAAAQQRFRAAAKQAKREGKKGKSYARRVGELLRGRASHGGGHKTKSAHHVAPSHHSSGGGSTDRKPKPRVAVYLGLGITAVRAVAGLPATKPATITAAAHNVAESFHDTGTVVQTYAPAAIGLGVSIVADAVGANKRLARMRLPFRV